MAPCFSTISKTATEFIEVFTYPSLSTVEDGLDILTLNLEDLPPFPWHIPNRKGHTERFGYVAQPVRARHS